MHKGAGLDQYTKIYHKYAYNCLTNGYTNMHEYTSNMRIIV